MTHQLATDAFTDVKVPLLGLEDASKIMVIGDPGASQVVYCQAGFPDDHHAFLPFARRLAKEKGCLVGVGCMPEYDTDGSAPLLRPEGYSFDETGLCFAQAVEALRSVSTNSNAELVLVVHDWAGAPGFIYTNRGLAAGNGTAPSKLVVLDVLAPTGKGDAAPAPVTYMMVLSTAFSLSRYSISLAKMFFAVAITLVMDVFGRWLNPDFPNGNPIPKGSVKSLAILPRICYPYWHMFREISGKSPTPTALRFYHLPDLSKIDILFLFGKKKNMMYHTQQALEALGSAKGSSYAGIENAGHWPHHDQLDEVIERVTKFLG